MKKRLTRFARFLLALIIIVPVSFVASHMINNDGKFEWEKFKHTFDSIRPNAEAESTTEVQAETDEVSDVETTTTETEDVATAETTSETSTEVDAESSTTTVDHSELNDSIRTLNMKLRFAQDEIQDLKNRLDERNRLRKQIDSLKQVINE